jgi:hypothetical protein
LSLNPTDANNLVFRFVLLNRFLYPLLFLKAKWPVKDQFTDQNSKPSTVCNTVEAGLFCRVRVFHIEQNKQKYEFFFQLIIGCT